MSFVRGYQLFRKKMESCSAAPCGRTWIRMVGSVIWSCGALWKPFNSKTWWRRCPIKWVTVKTSISQIAFEKPQPLTVVFPSDSRYKFQRGWVAAELRSTSVVLSGASSSQRSNLLGARWSHIQSRFRVRKAVSEMLQWCVPRQDRYYDCCEYWALFSWLSAKLQHFST